MISITVYRNQKEEYLGFDCLGHAGYADSGEDVVCAGVSALVLNTINTIACFTGEKFTTDTDEDTGKILVKFEQPAGHDAELMMKSLVLGLQEIQNNYGVDYVTLNFKEV